MISVQRAQEVVKTIFAELEVPFVPPPIYVSTELNKMYAGAYYDHPDGDFIIIRPEYFSDRTIAHELGHVLHHLFKVTDCHGGDPECERTASMVERWWVNRQKQLGLLTEDWKAGKEW